MLRPPGVVMIRSLAWKRMGDLVGAILYSSMLGVRSLKMCVLELLKSCNEYCTPHVVNIGILFIKGVHVFVSA